MSTEPAVIAIAHVIQTSVAPVFLLSGVAALLSMLTTRLGRVVDRARVIEAQFPNVSPEREPSLCTELDRMALRARLIGRAITLCTGCALLICAVIVVLFVGAFVDVNLSVTIASGFVAGMLMLIGGLSCFLREVLLATRYLRIGKFGEGMAVKLESPGAGAPSQMEGGTESRR
jgi:hypothetical protein